MTNVNSSQRTPLPIEVDWSAVWYWIYSLEWTRVLELVVGAAVVVGTIIASKQFRETQKSNRLTHKPWLTFTSDADIDPVRTISIVLENEGQGTAIIKDVKIEVDANPPETPKDPPKFRVQETPFFADDWRPILDKVGISVCDYRATAFGHPERPLKAGGELLILRISGANRKPLDKNTFEIYLDRLAVRLRIMVFYESVYGEVMPPATYGPFARDKSDPTKFYDFEELHRKMENSHHPNE
ncbi:MAG: hypothetical protein IIA11_05760 [Proteobacteria bacterium]|nr:hypothetical protein [Pseudomonadota bacterium]